MNTTLLKSNQQHPYSENGIVYPSQNVMLDLKQLKKVYPTPKGEYIVLDDLNLQIMKEEFVTIIGHSGCGKTTMLSMIAGLNDISGGSISVLGKHIKGSGPDRGVIFQSG
jgi:nitrate/nitrite transport system ATP-binding protein